MEPPKTLKDRYIYRKTYLSLFFTFLTQKLMKNRVQAFTGCFTLIAIAGLFYWFIWVTLTLREVNTFLSLLQP